MKSLQFLGLSLVVLFSTSAHAAQYDLCKLTTTYEQKPNRPLLYRIEVLGFTHIEGVKYPEQTVIWERHAALISDFGQEKRAFYQNIKSWVKEGSEQLDLLQASDACINYEDPHGFR